MAGTRSNRIVSLGLLIALLIGGLVATNSLRPTVTSESEVPGTTPIRHVVVIMKENHAFDNYFGTFPGVYGTPSAMSLPDGRGATSQIDRKSTRLNSSHPSISYAVFCLKKKKTNDPFSEGSRIQELRQHKTTPHTHHRPVDIA